MNSGIEQLKDGMWVIAGDTHISQWVKEHGTLACDPALFAEMRGWLSDPAIKVVWDVGACIGDHTTFYLSLGKAVVAVEPNPLAFRCLEHNCPEAILVNAAASSKSGILHFSPLENVGASRITPQGTIEVHAQRLDDMCLPDPDFVKIDVEGWEPHAIEGMTGTLLRCHPVVFVEINRGALAANGFSPEDVLKPFHDAGYTRFEIYPVGTPQDSEQFDMLISR